MKQGEETSHCSPKGGAVALNTPLLLAAVLPKCPMCIMGYSALISADMAALATSWWLLAGCIAIGLLALATAAYRARDASLLIVGATAALVIAIASFTNLRWLCWVAVAILVGGNAAARLIRRRAATAAQTINQETVK